MLKTKRLLLREYIADDMPAILSLTSDPGVRKFVGNLPNSLEDAWSRLLRWRGHWSLFGYGNLAVVDKQSNQLIGEVGASHFHRDIDSQFTGLPEASWFFCEESRGRGYAFEAMSAFVDWIEKLPSHRGVACLIEPDNRSSLRLAEKVGFLSEGTVTYRDRTFEILVRK